MQKLSLSCKTCHVDSCMGCGSDEPEVIHTCEECGEEIFEGDVYYVLRETEIYCMVCVRRKTAYGG